MGDTQINPNVLIGERELLRRIDFARERHVPHIDFPLDCHGLDLALNRTVELDLDFPYLRQVERMPIKFPTGSIRVGEALIAIAPLETGITRMLARFAATEEVLKCLVKPS